MNTKGQEMPPICDIIPVAVSDRQREWAPTKTGLTSRNIKPNNVSFIGQYGALTKADDTLLRADV